MPKRSIGSKSRRNTKSFIHELKLRPSKHAQRKLNIKFNCLRELYNNVLGECFKRLRQLRFDPLYAVAIDYYKSKEKEKGQAILKELNIKYGLTKTKLQTFATSIKNNTYMADHLDGDTVQVISDRAFDAFSDWMFKKGGRPRFKSWKNALSSIQGKKNSCILFKNGKVKWKELKINVIYDKKDKHGIEAHALNQRVKYCRLKRRFIKGQYHYYIQLVLEGVPKSKINPPNKKVGIDIGVSTIAAISKNKAILKPFCHNLESIQQDIKIIQRKMARSQRKNNPNNYNDDGTIKKGKKIWKNSNNYLKLQYQLKELYRKQSDKRKMAHNLLVKEILLLGKNIHIEKNNYKAWQKGWFGKTIGFRAPSQFVSTLKRKAESAGGTWEEINTFTTKLSQLCHVCENYKKKPLSQRTHHCCEITVQRDLYSGLLALYYNPTQQSVDTKSLRKDFRGYDQILNNAVSALNKLQIRGIIPSSLGRLESREEQFAFKCS